MLVRPSFELQLTESVRACATDPTDSRRIDANTYRASLNIVIISPVFLEMTLIRGFPHIAEKNGHAACFHMTADVFGHPVKGSTAPFSDAPTIRPTSSTAAAKL